MTETAAPTAPISTDTQAWKKYSAHIASLASFAMARGHITQLELSRRLGCTQQNVSNILRGKANMTLDTICRLESALDIDILSPILGGPELSSYDGVEPVRPRYLSDSDPK